MQHIIGENILQRENVELLSLKVQGQCEMSTPLCYF